MTQQAADPLVEGLSSTTALGERARARLDARVAVLAACRAYVAASTRPAWAAKEEFCVAYGAGLVEVPEAVRQALPQVSVASLWRWEKAVASDGVGRLAGRYGEKTRGQGLIDRQPELEQLVVGILMNKPEARPSHVLAVVQARFGKRHDVQLPTLRTLERWMEAWKEQNAEVHLAKSHPDAWKGKYMVAFGSQSEGIDRLNQRWEYDSTPADVMLVDGRHAILGVVDVASRQGKLLVSPTSKSTSIGLLTRRAMLDWGVPEEAKTDNGQDYVSQHLQRVFLGLGINHKTCPPFQPWHKPHIERFFRTFSHGILELLDDFCGHDVAGAQRIRDRHSFAERLFVRGAVVEVDTTAAELQRFCDSWIRDVYAHNPHEGLVGRTPFDMAAELAAAGVKRIADERALDLLLAEAPRGGTRTVLKKGLRLEDTWFIAPELGGHIGRQVQVRLDPADMGRVAVFLAATGAFLCWAECPERTGISRTEVAQAAKRIQQARLKEQKAALRATERGAKLGEMVEEVLAARAEEAAKLATLPPPTEEHDTPALQAAGEAVRALEEALARAEQAPPALAALPVPENVVPVEEFAQRVAAQQQAKPPRRSRADCETPWALAWWSSEEELAGRLEPEDAAWLAAWRRENPSEAEMLRTSIEMRYGRRAVRG